MEIKNWATIGLSLIGVLLLYKSGNTEYKNVSGKHRKMLSTKE